MLKVISVLDRDGDGKIGLAELTKATRKARAKARKTGHSRVEKTLVDEAGRKLVTDALLALHRWCDIIHCSRHCHCNPHRS